MRFGVKSAMQIQPYNQGKHSRFPTKMQWVNSVKSPIANLLPSGRKGTVMKHYYINNNQTCNPGFHHEVHTKEHAEQLRISSKTYLGYFSSEVEAVQEGKKYYSDADGCAICCPKAHRG